jgi:hypothetical protein
LLTTGSSNILIGVNANATAVNSTNQLSIGSSGQYVATNGAAATYFPNANTGVTLPPAGSNGFIRIILNGSVIKVAVYGD